jgi:hypothetical protein
MSLAGEGLARGLPTGVIFTGFFRGPSGAPIDREYGNGAPRPPVPRPRSPQTADYFAQNTPGAAETTQLARRGRAVVISEISPRDKTGKGEREGEWLGVRAHLRYGELPQPARVRAPSEGSGPVGRPAWVIISRVDADARGGPGAGTGRTTRKRRKEFCRPTGSVDSSSPDVRPSGEIS